MQEVIILTAMSDAPATQKQNNDNLERQAKARRIKEEIIKEKNLEKATEEYIDGMVQANVGQKLLKRHIFRVFSGVR